MRPPHPRFREPRLDLGNSHLDFGNPFLGNPASIWDDLDFWKPNLDFGSPSVDVWNSNLDFGMTLILGTPSGRWPRCCLHTGESTGASLHWSPAQRTSAIRNDRRLQPGEGKRGARWRTVGVVCSTHGEEGAARAWVQMCGTSA
ncbi:hypothetical protein ACOMHN_009144 [Nucella lapillus]